MSGEFFGGGSSTPGAGTITNSMIASNAAIAASKLDGTLATKNYQMRTGAIAETFPRAGATMVATVAALTTSVTRLVAISLPASTSIGHITFMSGTTALSVGTHQWFFLTDANRVLLATTTDDTSTAWGSNSEKTLAISTIASGASTSYPTSAAGLYYVGICVTATTVPTLQGSTGGVSNVVALAPVISGTSDTDASGPPSFPVTLGALSSDAKVPWAWVS